MEVLPLTKLKYLFWEYDLNSLDLEKNKQFIIERALEKGNMISLRALLQAYSPEEILKTINTSENISSATKNFWKLFFNETK